MKKTTYLAVAGMALFLIFGLWYFLREEPLPVKQPAAEQTTTEKTPGITFSGNSIIEEKDGKLLWELKADSIEVNPETKVLTLFNLQATYHQSPDNIIKITSKEAVMDTKTHDIVMKGAVNAVSSDGTTFQATELRYLNKQNKFHGTGNVVITKSDTIITGEQIESDNKMEKVTIRGNARAVKGGQNL